MTSQNIKIKNYMAIVYYLKVQNCANTVIVGGSGEEYYLIIRLDLEKHGRMKLV